MSDTFEMLVDVDATTEEAVELSKQIVVQFRHKGLIAGQPNEDYVLGGVGYRPGPEIEGLYQNEKGEYPFWELQTCGIEIRVGKGFNEWALCECCEGFTCPVCHKEIDDFDDEFQETFNEAIVQWLDESGNAEIACPKCHKRIPVVKWECKPPLAFGNMAIRFWNWPSLDSKTWKVVIIGLVRDVTKHNIVYTYGRV